MNAVDRLSRTVDDFCEFVESHPIAGSVSDEWGVREVLAHLVYHHESYVAQARARINRCDFHPLDGKWREINAQAVAAFKDVPIPKLVRRFRAANGELTRLYRSCNPARLPMQLKLGVKPRTLAELIPGVEAHIRNHQHKLLRMERAVTRSRD